MSYPELIRRFAGYNVDPSGITTNLVTAETDVGVITNHFVTWMASAPCSQCGSYPSGSLHFTWFLPKYNNDPAIDRKRRNYALLGQVIVWIYQRKSWYQRNWRRLEMRSTGIIETPRALNSSACVYNMPLDVYPIEDLSIYEPEPTFIEPITCPPCFSPVNVIRGFSDDFESSGCLLKKSVEVSAICVPIPRCDPNDPRGLPEWPNVPTVPHTQAWAGVDLPPLPVAPPCLETFRRAISKERIYTAQHGLIWSSTVIRWTRITSLSCPLIVYNDPFTVGDYYALPPEETFFFDNGDGVTIIVDRHISPENYVFDFSGDRSGRREYERIVTDDFTTAPCNKYDLTGYDLGGWQSPNPRDFETAVRARA